MFNLRSFGLWNTVVLRLHEILRQPTDEGFPVYETVVLGDVRKTACNKHRLSVRTHVEPENDQKKPFHDYLQAYCTTRAKTTKTNAAHVPGAMVS